MKFHFLLLSILFSCKQKELQVKHPVITLAVSHSLVINYDSCKKQILILKQRYKTVWKQVSKNEKEKIFTSAVVETIIPEWIGTAWNFYGTSEKPHEGTIACGYFVTTILRDAGVNLARIKLAQ